jgi:hypothetical protein
MAQMSLEFITCALVSIKLPRSFTTRNKPLIAALVHGGQFNCNGFVAASPAVNQYSAATSKSAAAVSAVVMVST